MENLKSLFEGIQTDDLMGSPLGQKANLRCRYCLSFPILCVMEQTHWLILDSVNVDRQEAPFNST